MRLHLSVDELNDVKEVPLFKSHLVIPASPVAFAERTAKKRILQNRYIDFVTLWVRKITMTSQICSV